MKSQPWSEMNLPGKIFSAIGTVFVAIALVAIGAIAVGFLWRGVQWAWGF